jgi:hypothetical protein
MDLHVVVSDDGLTTTGTVVWVGEHQRGQTGTRSVLTRIRWDRPIASQQDGIRASQALLNLALLGTYEDPPG